MEPLLAIEDLHVRFHRRDRIIRALNGVSLEVRAGEVCALVGESGSGKSLTALATLGLQPPDAEIAQGRIVFEGTDLLAAGEGYRRRLRGGTISMILQDPMTALNPVLPIGLQVGEPLSYHRRIRGAPLREAVVDLLARVRIPRPAENVRAYPHQLSGGMRQRVAAAAAVAAGPRLLIADEPTAALDVSLQAEFVRLLRELQRERGMAILFISHDLPLVLEFAQRIVVMYAGMVMEAGTAPSVLGAPRHPYTQALLACVPSLAQGATRLAMIPGTPPDPAQLPSGCPFAPRCPEAREVCAEPPPVVGVGPGHEARCWMRV